MKAGWRISLLCVSLAISVTLYFLSPVMYVTVHMTHFRSEIHQESAPKNCESSVTIPGFMYDIIDQIVAGDQLDFPNCKVTGIRKNLVYIKTHKCASDTLSAIFRRFALDHGFNVMLPISHSYLLGWPHQMTSFMYRPQQKGRQFNIILDHAVYNRTKMSALMPPDTVYTTSFREPGERLTSALTYFAVAKCGFMEKDLVESGDRVNVTREFLSNMDHYDTAYRSIENLYSTEICGCIPNGVSMVKNAMAFDMGFPVGYHMGTVDQQQNYVFIMDWLRQIHKEFPIFILTEHFAESMVLLKRYMCWPMKAILYKKLNDWKTPKIEYPPEQMASYRNWTNVDTLVYDMFYKLYKKRVYLLGQDFKDETVEYLSQLNKTKVFCNGNHNEQLEVTMSATRWNEAYTMTHEDCLHMHDSKHLRSVLKDLYDLAPPPSYQDVQNEAFSSKYKWC